MPTQFDAAGNLRHLLTLDGLSRNHIQSLLDGAENFLRPPWDSPARSDALLGHTVVNLFYEPSTRTRASFELAARRLGAEVLNLEFESSAQVKGESVLDTLSTLQAMYVDIFVLRHGEAGVAASVAKHVAPHVSVLNAGEAHLSHPTQGLIDLLTIRQCKHSFEDLVVAIVGDIRHSRVARSAYHGLRAMGIGEIRLVGPQVLLPEPEDMIDTTRCATLDEGVRDADVVMALRIQRERIREADIPDSQHYFAAFGLTEDRLTLAKADVVVMHPGPMNRGVEISPEVADGPRSVITRQVTNGVAVRMAVLTALAKSLRERQQVLFP